MCSETAVCLYVDVSKCNYHILASTVSVNFNEDNNPCYLKKDLIFYGDKHFALKVYCIDLKGNISSKMSQLSAK